MSRTKITSERRDGDADADDRTTVWSAGLKVGYDEVAQEPMPDRFHELLRQLDDAESRER